MFNLSAASVAVAVDTAGRPHQVRSEGQRYFVTGVESVRDVTSAYPLEVGPHTVLVVRASDRRFRLVHLFRDRCWTVEELSVDRTFLASAA